MPDLFFIILIFVFFILPLLERVLKGGQQPRPPQQQQRPARRTPATRTPARTPTGAEPLPPAREEPQTAADMIPEDLWEILTGERRIPTPQPADVEAAEEEAWLPTYDEDAELAPEIRDEEVYVDEIEPDELEQAEALQLERERAVHTVERAPQHMPESWAGPGHTTARARERRPLAAVPVAGPTRAHRAVRMNALAGASRSELQRAIVLREVLGPPKGLEEAPDFR